MMSHSVSRARISPRLEEESVSGLWHHTTYYSFVHDSPWKTFYCTDFSRLHFGVLPILSLIQYFLLVMVMSLLESLACISPFQYFRLACSSEPQVRIQAALDFRLNNNDALSISLWRLMLGFFAFSGTSRSSSPTGIGLAVGAVVCSTSLKPRESYLHCTFTFPRPLTLSP